jgi:hypothetical protein
MAYGLITSCKLINPYFYITFNELHYNDKELKKYILINGCKYITTNYIATKKYNLTDVKDYRLCVSITAINNYNCYVISAYNTELHTKNTDSILHTHKPNLNILQYDYNRLGISKNIRLLNQNQLEILPFV